MGRHAPRASALDDGFVMLGSVKMCLNLQTWRNAAYRVCISAVLHGCRLL